MRFAPDGNAIAISSIEGRAAVEFLHELGRGEDKKKFAFKCHRVGDLVHPVNAIDFHPISGTFATGGCDGTVGTSVTGCRAAHCQIGFWYICVITHKNSIALQLFGTDTTRRN